MALIIRVLRLKTKTRTMMTSLRFSHADLWSGNLLRKDNNKILAIDFEMATTAPGFVDLGGLLFNWDFHFEENLKYLDPRIRETMVANYLGQIVLSWPPSLPWRRPSSEPTGPKGPENLR